MWLKGTQGCHFPVKEHRSHSLPDSSSGLREHDHHHRQIKLKGTKGGKNNVLLTLSQVVPVQYTALINIYLAPTFAKHYAREITHYLT